jgi:hypothetical protein
LRHVHIPYANCGLAILFALSARHTSRALSVLRCRPYCHDLSSTVGLTEISTGRQFDREHNADDVD